MFKTRVTPKYDRGELPVEYTAIKYDEVLIGEEMGPLEFDISAQTHQKHCDLFHHHQPWFEKEQHLFPWEMWSAARIISRWKYGRLNNLIQSELEWNFFKPAKVGEKLFGTVWWADKFEKRGKRIVSMTSENRDAKGQLVSRAGDWPVLLGEVKGKMQAGTITKEREQEKGWWSEAKPGTAKPATRDLPVGFILPSNVRPPIVFRVSGAAAGGWAKDKWKNNIHEDEHAQKLGYQGGVVEGPIVFEDAFLDIFLNFFGPEKFFTTGHAHTKVCGAGYMGDIVVGKARVCEKVAEEKGLRITLEVRAEKDNGKLLHIGTASALVD